MRSFQFTAVIGMLLAGSCSASTTVEENLGANQWLQKLLESDVSFSIEPEEMASLNDALDTQLLASMEDAFGSDDLVSETFDSNPDSTLLMVESSVWVGLRGYRSHDSHVMVMMELPEGTEISGFEVDVTVSRVTLAPVLLGVLAFAITLTLLVTLISWYGYDDEDDEEYDDDNDEEEEYLLETKADALNVSPQEQLETPLL